MQIFIFGDSITLGAWDKKGGWADRLKQELHIRSIRSGFEEYYEVYNLGVSGDSSKNILDRFGNELKKRHDPEDTSVIIIACGVNDSQYYISNKRNEISLDDFEKNIQSLLSIAKNYTESIIFTGLTPVDESLVNPMPWKMESGYRMEDIEKYHQSVKDFCMRKHLLFVDMLDEFKKTDYKKLLADGVHPNTKGHELIHKSISSKPWK